MDADAARADMAGEMTSADQVRAREGACRRVAASGRRVAARDGVWEARGLKFQCVAARVARDRRSSNFERRVRAREVSDGDEASTDV